VTPVATQLALADLLATIGKVDDARLAYGKLEIAYPDNADVLLALGQFAIRLEDFPGARRFLDRAIRVGTASARVFYDYAVVLRNMNEPDAVVVENLTRSVTLDDKFFEGHHYLGFVHLQAERLAPAVVHLKRAAELQPGRISVWENLAVAYQKAGQKDAARSAAKAALRLASIPEETARINALLDLIESDADNIVVAPFVRPTSPVDAAPALARLDGMLTQVDCLGKQARLHIAGPRDKTFLLVRDASSVRLRGTGAFNIEMQCGPLPARPVLVEFRPAVHATYGTSGVVVSIDFR
jgi:Flp pilus assembly protein TadD